MANWKKRRAERGNGGRHRYAGAKDPFALKNREGHGLRLAVREIGAVLLPRQWPAGDRPGRIDQDGADLAPVRDTVLEADMAGDRGQCGIPVVSGL